MKIKIETDGTCVGTKVFADGKEIKGGFSALGLHIGFDANESTKWMVRRGVTDKNGKLIRSQYGTVETEEVELATHIEQLLDGSYVSWKIES